MNKKWMIGIVVVVIVVLAWWMMRAEKAAAPTDDMADSGGVTATVYDQQLSGLDEVDMQAEFQGVDSDLNKL